METIDTFTINNLKMMIKLSMVKRRELIQKEREACTYRVMEGEEPSAKKPEYDYEETWDGIINEDYSVRLAKHSINSFSVSRFVPEYNMTLDELEMYLEDLDRREKTLWELKEARPMKRGIVKRRVEYSFINYDPEQVRKDFMKLSDERSKVMSIISEIQESEEFQNDYFEIELDEDESPSDWFSDARDQILDCEGKVADELYGYRKDDETEKELEAFLKILRD